jgi:hypothetical protein
LTTELRRRPYRYRTSFPLEEVDVVLADGGRRTLLRKDLRREALDPEARLAKPAFLHDARREIEAYGLLAGTSLGAPEVYDHGEDWLLLEKVAGIELWQADTLEPWCEAARWLARLHATFEGSPPRSQHLIVYDAAFFRCWAERAHVLVGRPLDQIVAGYEPVVERLCRLPVTFIHGEFYASNIIVAGARIAPVDWETAAVGPGPVDLAALVAGAWTEAERATIVAAYGDVDSEALDCCRLHVALQWLGWSKRWSPPAEHAHDWLADALAAAERLGLIE